MKIAITGHTSGIGKELFDRLSESHEVVGFSRSNGYDITKNVTSIVRSALGCDLFINNAHEYEFQTVLFNELFSYWAHDPSKFIINMGSVAKYTELYRVNEQSYYGKTKKELSEASIKASLSNKKCRVTCINPGWVDTPGSKEYTDITKMDISECADVIMSVINHSSKIEIPEISFLRRK